MNMKRRGFLGLLGAGVVLPFVPVKLPAEQQLQKEIAVPKEDTNDIAAFTESLYAKVYVNGETEDRNLKDCFVEVTPDLLRMDGTVFIRTRFKPLPTDNLNPLRLNVSVWKDSRFLYTYQFVHRSFEYDPNVEFSFGIFDSFYRLRYL